MQTEMVDAETNNTNTRGATGENVLAQAKTPQE